MANTTVNKVILGNETLIDISADTVTADKMLIGTVAHNKSGARITGTAVQATATATLISGGNYNLSFTGGLVVVS